MPGVALELCIGDVIDIKLPAPVGEWTLPDESQEQLFWLLFDETDVFGIASVVGIFTLDLIDTGNPSEPYVIQITITACDLTLLDIDCKDRIILLYWYNQAGGWSSFPFITKKTYGHSAGNNTTFKTSGLIRKFSSRDDKYKTYKLSTGYQSKQVHDHLETMFDSIQAFVAFPSALGSFADGIESPIIIDPKDINKYSDGSGNWETEFSFSIAQEKIIQTQ